MAGTATISVRPMHTEADYEDALAEVAALMDAQPGTAEGDRLDILATLVEAYEAKHHPIEPPDPIEAIKYRMEQRGMTPAALRPYIGSRGRISEILQRKRPLTLQMIRRLVTLGIPAGVLILPSGAPSLRLAKAEKADARKARVPAKKRSLGNRTSPTATERTRRKASTAAASAGATPQATAGSSRSGTTQKRRKSTTTRSR